MPRDEAYRILARHLHNKNLLKHSRACEVMMKAIYNRLTPEEKKNEHDETIWAITGLLHDGDYEVVQARKDLNNHGLILFELEPEIPEPIRHAIESHNPLTRVEPSSHLDWAIRCGDQLTGLIVAAALIHPEKKLEPITSDFVFKRFGEKAFAKGVDRNQIAKCEEKLNIPLIDFIELTLTAMKEIHEEIGL